MKKTQLLNSLKTIANELDNISLHKEANTITNVMIKIAQNEDTLNSFDEILDFKPSYLNDNPSLSAIRKKAQFFAIQIKQLKTKSQADTYKNQLPDKFKKSIEYIEQYGLPSGQKPDLEAMKLEAERLQLILSDYIENLINSLNDDMPTNITKEPIKQEEIIQVMQENQQKFDNDPNDEKARMMVELCNRLLNPDEFKQTPIGKEIEEERFRRRNPYWDPRD